MTEGGEFVPMGSGEEGGVEKRGDNPRIQTNWCINEQSGLYFWNCEVSQIQRRAEGCPDQVYGSTYNLAVQLYICI